MKRRTFYAALLAAGLGLGTVVAAPSAAAAPAQCQYIARDLPIPAGASSARAVSSSSDDQLVLGEVFGGGRQHGVIWRNGSLWQVLNGPPSGARAVPKGLNNSGRLVVGYMADSRGYTAYRQLVGRYFKLHTLPDDHSIATAVNDNGDIAGAVFPISGGDVRTAVVWERDKAGYTMVGPGQPILITNDRKVLTDRGQLFDLATKTSVQLAGQTPFVLDNGRIFGFLSAVNIVEWNTSGQQVATYTSGVVPLGVNNHNTVFGSFNNDSNRVVPGLWRNGTWTAIQADKLPETLDYGDISDDDVLIGTYRTNDGIEHPAQWFCAP